MLRSVLGAVAIVVSMALAGCSFSPVYSDGSPINAMSLAFDLGKPNSRLEQVVYQELALRFATSTAPNTPKLVVSTAAAHNDQFLSQNPGVIRDGVNIGNSEMLSVTVDVTVVVTSNGKELLRATRSATAQYRRDSFNTTAGGYSSVLANNSAAQAAEESAAKAATESLRLTLLAKFPQNGSYL